MGRPLPTLARLTLLGAVALAGCESLRPKPSAPPADRAQAPPAPPPKPGANQPPLRVAQFVLWSDVPLEPGDALFRELEDLPDQLQQELRVPVGANLVQVYLFDTQDKYEAFMRDRFPWLPARRAYFIGDQKRPGSGSDLQVYTWLGPHLRTDLRHELTHALLHGALRHVPLWLDEGLAGFFEQPPGADGVNPEHLEVLRKGPFLPDLGRLERVGDVKQMEKPEYREAWAWVHYMLRGDPRARAVLLAYLQELRENPSPGPLLPRLAAAVPETGLSAHLGRVEVPSPVRRTGGR